jgi:hypothetical protein
VFQNVFQNVINVCWSHESIICWIGQLARGGAYRTVRLQTSARVITSSTACSCLHRWSFPESYLWMLLRNKLPATIERITPTAVVTSSKFLWICNNFYPGCSFQVIFSYFEITLVSFKVLILHVLVKPKNLNHRKPLYSLIWDFLLSQINIWTTTTWSNVWVVLPKPSWYEF